LENHRIMGILLALQVGLTAAAPLGAEGVAVEQVLAPDASPRYKHPAAITQLDDGDLLLAFHGGAGEYDDDTAVWANRLKAGGTRWAAPRVIADTPFHGDGNPVVWQGPGGTVWLFYVVRYGKTWSDSRIHCKVSRDGAHTWSDAFVLAFEPGMMVRNRPIVLAGGDYLLPVYQERGHDRELVGADSTSLFLRYHPETREWTRTPPIHSRLGNIQPGVVELAEGHLVCYCRRGGGYDGRPDGYLVFSESRDGGKTWAPGKDSPFPNPNAAVDLLKLRSGNLLLVYNDSMKDRTPLTAALSTDGGKTFPHRRNVAEGPGDFAYPYAVQTRDGKVHLVFTSHERTAINRTVFDERWLLDAPPRKEKASGTNRLAAGPLRAAPAPGEPSHPPRPTEEEIKKGQEAVNARLEKLHGQGAQVQYVADEAVTDSLPGWLCYAVLFRQYPVARLVPEGLSAGNVFAVLPGGKVETVSDPKALRKFFRAAMRPVRVGDAARQAAAAWLRLSEALHQDGFYQFAIPDKELTVEKGGREAHGKAVVERGGNGEIKVALTFDADGKLDRADETAKLRPGPRPICQATKLLDPDPIIRRMAEQDLLIMGRAAKGYLDEQRARAAPPLRKAIDRLWQRILDEEP
jgi:predicted neuraminidase